MDDLTARLSKEIAATGFCGLIDIRRDDQPLLSMASGIANRSKRSDMSHDTVFATASAAKGITALTIASLIDEGLISFDSRAKEILGDQIVHLGPCVTIEHLLTHTSGVGDYLDEDEDTSIEDFRLPIPVGELLSASDYIPLVDLPPAAPPGEHFKYNNSGFVLLALVIEAAGGASYHEQVQARVFDPAEMSSSAFHRSDQLPLGAAIGYLANGETNHECIPFAGIGDGGLYTTAADLHRFWTSLLSERIVSGSAAERMLVQRNKHDAENAYGMGFWLQPGRSTVALEGMDAGVSMRSVHERRSGITFTVMSNTTSGAWPLVKLVDDVISEVAAESMWTQYVRNSTW